MIFAAREFGRVSHRRITRNANFFVLACSSSAVTSHSEPKSAICNLQFAIKSDAAPKTPTLSSRQTHTSHSYFALRCPPRLSSDYQSRKWKRRALFFHRVQSPHRRNSNQPKSLAQGRDRRLFYP